MQRAAVGAVAFLLAVAGAMQASPARPAPPAVVFTGTVRGPASRPLSGATVGLMGTANRTTTRADGTYRLVAPAAVGNEVTLSASIIGYAAASRTLRVNGDSMRVDFQLSADVLQLEGVVVNGVGTRAGRVRTPVGIAPPPTAAAPPMSPPVRSPDVRDWNTEAYATIDENAFRAVDHEPLSTFSADVDRASYANVRRFLMEGRRPPVDAVRIEEMINYFPYERPARRTTDPITVVTEVADAPWRAGHRLLRIGLSTTPVDLGGAPAGNLVFLIDVSGSMNGPDRLPLVKRSLRLLVDQLREDDRVAIVVYAGAAGLVLPSTRGSDRRTILDAIERLEAGGSTAGGEGLRLAYDVARSNYVRGGNNRVILATDGDFNVGVSSDAEMVRLIEEKRREGTFLTVLGFGRGNLKDSKMEQLADRGNGNYAYIDNLLEARKVLVSEMGGTLLTVAKDVKLQVEFNPARVRAYRLIGYENRLLANQDFNDDTKDAGEMGAGHTVTALYEIIPVGVRSDAVVRGVDSLRYRTAAPAPARTSTGELAFVKVRYKLPDGDTSRLLEHPVRDTGAAASADFTFATAVAGFGMLLRESEHRGTLTLDQVVRLAEGSRGADPEGYRGEFVRLVWLFGEMRSQSAGADR
ncbi:MAG TPA: von Willebrand factor type A domain-containing protein [Longimicrobium sp.]